MRALPGMARRRAPLSWFRSLNGESRSEDETRRADDLKCRGTAAVVQAAEFQRPGIIFQAQAYRRAEVSDLAGDDAPAPSIGGESVHFPMYHQCSLDDERRGFDRQLRDCDASGDFLDADDAVDALARPGGIGGRYFCITFDDGFKDSLTNALPC